MLSNIFELYQTDRIGIRFADTDDLYMKDGALDEE